MARAPALKIQGEVEDDKKQDNRSRIKNDKRVFKNP